MNVLQYSNTIGRDLIYHKDHRSLLDLITSTVFDHQIILIIIILIMF